MLLVLQIAQYEAVALEVKKLLLVLFWTVFRIMRPGLTKFQELDYISSKQAEKLKSRKMKEG